MHRLFLSIVLIGCGPTQEIPEPQYYTPRFHIGVRVEEGSPSWTFSPDLPGRIDSIAEEAIEYSNGDADRLRGIVVVLIPAHVTCDGNLTIGCYRHNDCDGWIEITSYFAAMPDGSGGTWLEWNPGSIESTVLRHEFLHVLGVNEDHVTDTIP